MVGTTRLGYHVALGGVVNRRFFRRLQLFLRLGMWVRGGPFDPPPVAADPTSDSVASVLAGGSILAFEELEGALWALRKYGTGGPPSAGASVPRPLPPTREPGRDDPRDLEKQ
jgi:hypothetical protein